MPERISSGFFTFDENIVVVKLSSPKKQLSPKKLSSAKPNKDNIIAAPETEDPFFFQ